MKNVNYERYSSKIKRINIPVPTYSPKQNSDHFRVLKIYHTIRNWWLKASVNSISESLIGRDVLVEKLKNLLLRDKKSSGSYLVTGYRGMNFMASWRPSIVMYRWDHYESRAPFSSECNPCDSRQCSMNTSFGAPSLLSN